MKFPSLLATVSAISTVSAITGKVDTIHNPNYNPHGPSLYLDALLKHKIEPTHPAALPLKHLIPHVGHLKNRRCGCKASSNSSTPQAFSPAQDEGLFYLNPVTIGEGDSAQTFWLQFDTASPDLWVFSNLVST
jgi:hypothetical protein